jgi:hypothetical protein
MIRNTKYNLELPNFNSRFSLIDFIPQKHIMNYGMKLEFYTTST